MYVPILGRVRGAHGLMGNGCVHPGTAVVLAVWLVGGGRDREGQEGGGCLRRYSTVGR